MVQDVRRCLLDDFLLRKITRKIPNLKTKKEETIMRKSKMTILGCMGVFLIAALVLIPAAQAGEKTIKYKVFHYITKSEVVPVPDVEKHVVGVYERRGVAMYENGETAAFHTRGTFDVVKGQGEMMGYCNISFADGSTYMTKYQGTITTAKGEKLSTSKGTGVYFKGTGRYEGIKGKFSLTSRKITPYTKDKTKSDMVTEVTGTYTLPKK